MCSDDGKSEDWTKKIWDNLTTSDLFNYSFVFQFLKVSPCWYKDAKLEEPVTVALKIYGALCCQIKWQKTTFDSAIANWLCYPLTEKALRDRKWLKKICPAKKSASA